MGFRLVDSTLLTGNIEEGGGCCALDKIESKTSLLSLPCWLTLNKLMYAPLELEVSDVGSCLIVSPVSCSESSLDPKSISDVAAEI